METADLSAPGYWDDPAPDFRCNPVGSPIQQGLMDQARAEPRLAGHVLIATSGSTGEPKWIALSKRALLASAGAVNAHLGATPDDRWLCALPDFHVGGLGVHARAYLLGQLAEVFPGTWRNRAGEFAAMCRSEGSTLTSLTPTQVFDLVAKNLAAPPRLRAAIVGGGRLDPELKQRARALGWPLLESYGLTEGASQIATGEGDDGWLPVLPHWEVAAGAEGRLRIRGSALFSGTLDPEGRYDPAPLDADGWFETRDVVALRGRTLRFIGRADDWVKKLGELVPLDNLRGRFEALAGNLGRTGTIVALPDARMGHRLVAVFEGADVCARCVRDFNETVPPYSRIDESRCVPNWPRTDLGKIRWSELARLLAD